MSSAARVAPERELGQETLNLPVTPSNQNISALSGHVDANTDSVTEYTGPVESVLPREFRQRLHKHFSRIEREFEREYRRLYGDNLALQERLEKFEDTEHSEGTTLAKKLGASLLSQRFKQQYKQSASRFVSSLRPSTGHGGATAGPNPVLTSGHAAGAGVISSALHMGGTCGTQPNPPTTASSTVFAGTLAGHGGSWQLINRITGHRDGIWEVTPHRRFLATASADNTVRLWTNSAQANCLMVYLGHYGSANSVRFRTRDHLLLTSSGDGTAHLIRLPFDLLMKAANCLNTVSQTPTTSSSAVVAAFEAANSALTSEFAGSGAMGLGVGSGPNVRMPPVTGAPLEAEDSLVTGVETADDTTGSPIRTTVALGTTVPIYVRHPHAIFQSANLSSPGPNVAGGSGLATACIDSSPLSAADFLTGREQLVTAGWDRLGRIYDLSTGQEVSSLTGHDHQLTDVRCAPCGAPLVVTSSRDCTFRLWDFRQPGMRVHVQQAHNQTVSTTQFLSGGTTERLISAGADRLCRIWDLRQSRGPVITIRTDSGINRLSVSGSTTMFVGLLTGDSSADPGSSISTASIVPVSSSGGGMAASATGTNASANTNPVSVGNATGTTITAAPTGEGPTSLLSLPTQVSVSTTTGISQPTVSYSSVVTPGSGSTITTTTGSGGHAQSWATNTMRILALPLENRGIKFFDLNGNRIGRITRSSSRGHARMVTSVAWADEGYCNFFSTSFDSRLLAWQIHLGNQ
ncbi:WD repeat-containing protein 37 [Fasciola gigantica]|uniref:WD repeat-containing protein 37 n=1 Tax=Fasciola gigantica TaxID=46835 RepID=A0A504YTB1_FASGI|nr:WD repeat-containing protein 37 [Fasciola gigantica]